MIAEITKEEFVRSHFEMVQNNLEYFKNTRHLFYVAHDFMTLFEQSYRPTPGIVPSSSMPSYQTDKETGTQSPYRYPFVTALYFFIAQNRLEEAEKIVKSYFRHTPLAELLKILLATFHGDKEYNYDYDSRVFLDKLLCFLAQIGYEKKILDVITFSRHDAKLEKFMSHSWSVLLDRFVTKSKDAMLEELWKNLLPIILEYSPAALKEIKSISQSVKFRRWLLKRQMLTIYTTIHLNIDPEYSISKSFRPKLLEQFCTLLDHTIQNYRALVCDTAKEYLMATHYMLEVASNPSNNPIWSTEIIENMISQVSKVKNLYSDVADFFYQTINFQISTPYITWLEGKLKEKENLFKGSNIKDLLHELHMLINEPVEPDSTGEDLEDRVSQTNNSGGFQHQMDGDSSFWKYSKSRLTPERLRLLATSLDNQYSTASSYFFGVPTIKLDNDSRIDTEFCVVRKWGSTGGLFERDKYLNASYCGGYLIHHHGFGLIIDPGPDTLNLLNRYTDYDVMDINGVVCTHPHNDHVAEFKRVLLGVREYNTHAGFKRLYYLFPHDEDQELIHPKKLAEDFCIKLSPYPNHENPNHALIEYFFPDNDWGKKNGIRVIPVPVKHRIHSSRDASYGLLVSPLRNGEPLTTILFSGDAEYHPDGQLFKKIPPSCTPEVLVLNITSARMKDIMATEPGDKFKFPDQAPKKNHLGYTGVLALLSKLRDQYKVAIISDYFEAQSQGDNRLLINRSVERDLRIQDKIPPKIFAAEPGIRMRWREKDKLEIFCSNLCDVGNKGFVDPKGANVRQFKKNIFVRNEVHEMVCCHCEQLKLPT